MTSKPAELLRAMRLLSLGEPFLAERTASAGLRFQPEHGHLLEVRGIARHQLGQHAKAVDDLEAAMMTVTLNPLALWCLADSSAALHQIESAQRLLSWLADRDDCPTSLLPRVADLLGRTGAEESALDVLHLWCEREPARATPHWGMAYFMARLGYSHRAVILRLRSACERAPTNAQYRAQLGSAEAEAGDLNRARTILIDLPTESIRCPHLATRIARAWDVSGDFVRSHAWWSRALQLAEPSKIG